MPDELFCERLKRLRFAAGYSQRALERRLSLTGSSISDWELGVFKPRIDVLYRLASALHCSIDYLLTGRESPYRTPPTELPHSPLHRAIRHNNGSPAENDLGQNPTKSFRA